MPRTWLRRLEGTTAPRLRPWALTAIMARPGPTRVRRRGASRTCPHGRRLPRASLRRPPMASIGRRLKVRMAAGCTQMPSLVGRRRQLPCHRPCQLAMWCYRRDSRRCRRSARRRIRSSTHTSALQVQQAPHRGASSVRAALTGAGAPHPAV